MSEAITKLELRSETLEEKIVTWSVVATWALWAIGGLYIIGPALGWLLAVIALVRRHGLAGDDTPWPARTPTGCSVWLAGMGVLLVALLVAHIDLGAAQTLKSTVGWMKGWALMALFIYAGGTLRVRPEIVCRACNLLSMQTVVIGSIMFVAGQLHLPTLAFTSPLEILGGAGPDFFKVSLYQIDTETNGARWNFYSPWAPAAGLLANLSIVTAFFDRNRRRQAAGMLAAAMVCYMSQSRLAVLLAPVIGVTIFLASNLTRSYVLWTCSAACVGVLPFLGWLIEFITESQERFRNARAASSRVRDTLQSIAQHRWHEAPIWGHGTVERGPHLVEFMPIGSHHTWNALLYIKGGVGFAAMLGVMVYSLVEMTAKAQTDRVAQAALGVMIVLLIYTFAENLEILAYLYWPWLRLVGIAMKRRFVQPFHAFMGRH